MQCLQFSANFCAGWCQEIPSHLMWRVLAWIRADKLGQRSRKDVRP
jgi:hypothetical protein